MGKPITVDRYEYSKIEDQFQKEIKKQLGKKVEVGIVSSTLADLDNDGAQDDFAGTAILKVGRSFKSFIFLLREDGSARFLENNGADFDPKSGLSTLSCSSKPIACPDTMDRARHQIDGAKFYIMEFDKDKKGLEVVIPLGSGIYSVLNSLEIFLN